MAVVYRRVWPQGELVRVVLPAHLDLLARDFEAGISSALYEAIRYCHENALPLPNWAMNALDAEAAIALGQASPLNKRGQRGSQMKARELRQKQLMKAALHAVSRAGFSGRDRLTTAQEMLSSLGVAVGLETLRSPKGLDGVEFNTSQYDIFRRKLGLAEDQNGFLIEE